MVGTQREAGSGASLPGGPSVARPVCLLNCVACNLRPKIRFQASDMVLQINSGAASHVQPQARKHSSASNTINWSGTIMNSRS